MCFQSWVQTSKPLLSLCFIYLFIRFRYCVFNHFTRVWSSAWVGGVSLVSIVKHCTWSLWLGGVYLSVYLYLFYIWTNIWIRYMHIFINILDCTYQFLHRHIYATYFPCADLVTYFFPLLLNSTCLHLIRQSLLHTLFLCLAAPRILLHLYELRF